MQYNIGNKDVDELQDTVQEENEMLNLNDVDFYINIEFSLQNSHLKHYEATYYLDTTTKEIRYINDTIYELLENENYTPTEKINKLLNIINKMVDVSK